MKIESIMVVDDSEIEQMVTEDIIQNFDPTIKIFQAYDGQEALEMLNTFDKQPTVILLDINMPRMNGFEFLEEYKKRTKKADVVALHTSSADENDQKKSQKYDFVRSYFVKPLEIADLEGLRNLL